MPKKKITKKDKVELWLYWFVTFTEKNNKRYREKNKELFETFYKEIGKIFQEKQK